MATTFTSATKSVTTAGTQVALVSSSTKVGSIVIQANPANAGYIYVGDSTVADTNGIRLSAGEKITFAFDYVAYGVDTSIDISTIYIDSSVNGEGVRFMYNSFRP